MHDQGEKARDTTGLGDSETGRYWYGGRETWGCLVIVISLLPSLLACLLTGCAWLGLTRPSSVVHQMLGSAPRFCTGVCLFVTVSL